MSDKFAGRDFPVELFQPLDTVFAIVSHVTINGRVRNTSQPGGIQLRFAETDQPQHFHSQLHSRMLKRLCSQRPPLFIRKCQSSHP